MYSRKIIVKYIILHQWYWSYRYPDFATPEGDCVEFDSYLLTESDLDRGQLRKLDTDNLTVVPTNYVVRFLLESGDVIHQKKLF